MRAAREPFKCPDCGQIIKNPWPKQKRCSACADAARKKYARENYYLRTKPKKFEKLESEKALQQEQKPNGWSLKGKSANQVNAEALALGLSYGQYEALIDCEMIDRYCAGKGLDGMKVIDKAWQDYQKQRYERLSKL